MKVLIVNRFFGGAQIPTGRMAEDVARLLVESGHEVTALASTGTYAGAEKRALDYRTTGRRDDPPTRSPRRTAPAGQGKLSVETVNFPKWMPRALAWVWFTWQARKRIPRMDWDVCVLMTDPPLLPLLAAKAAMAGVSVGQCFGRAVEDERLKHRRTETPPHHATRRVAVWLMDLYPEALAASGRIGIQNPIYRWYFEKRQRALGAADLLICLGEAQKALVGKCECGCTKVEKWNEKQETADRRQQAVGTEILQHGNTELPIPPLTQCVRTAVVPPWDDRGNIALATEDSLKNFALYAGNLGEAHCFEEILAAAPYLPGDWTIRFAARGAKLGALRARLNTGHSRPEGDSARHSRGQINASQKKASHGWKKIDTDSFSAGDTGEKSLPPKSTAASGAVVHVSGYASEAETPGLLASARVHLITMSPGWEGIVVPSKLYGCIRTGRPVLFIGPENADTAREILAHDWGKVLPPGASGEEVAGAILDLAARPTRAVRPENGGTEVAELIQGLATD